MEMLKFNTGAIMFMLLTLLIVMSTSHGDSNFHAGNTCSLAVNSTENTSFQANLNTLLTSLSTNVVLQNGFYKTTVGKDSERIYGLIECRGDISSSGCDNCTSESIKIASRGCPNSRDVAIWFRWCMLRYSNESIFGVWEKSSMATPTGNGTDDDPVVGSKGSSMVTGLARTTPNQPGMFQTSVIDVGQGGKRYGMAQCRRDLSKSDCGKCLNGLLVSYQPQIANLRGWEIHGLSCGMWYTDFQFYFNYSTLGTSGVKRRRHGGVVATTVTLTIAIFLSVR